MLRFNSIVFLALSLGYATHSLADNTDAANLIPLDELNLKVRRVIKKDFDGRLKFKANFLDGGETDNINQALGGLHLKVKTRLHNLNLNGNFHGAEKRADPLAAAASAPPLSIEEFQAVLRGGSHSLRMRGKSNGGHRTLTECKYNDAGIRVCIHGLGGGQCKLTYNGDKCDCCNYDMSSGLVSAYDCSNIDNTIAESEGMCRLPGGGVLGENCSRHASGSIFCTNDLEGGICEMTLNGESCDCCNYDTSTGYIIAYDCRNLPNSDWAFDGTCESVGPDQTPEGGGVEDEIVMNCNKHDPSGKNVCVLDLGGGVCVMEFDGEPCNCCKYDDSTGDIVGYDCSNVGWASGGTCESALGQDDQTDSDCVYNEAGTHVCIGGLGDGQCSLTLDGDQCDCCNNDSSGVISAYDCTNIDSTIAEGTCTPPEEDAGLAVEEEEKEEEGENRIYSNCVPVEGEANVFRCCDGGSNNCVDISLMRSQGACRMNVVPRSNPLF